MSQITFFACTNKFYFESFYFCVLDIMRKYCCIFIGNKIRDFYLGCSKVFKKCNDWFWLKPVSDFMCKLNAIAKTNYICIFGWATDNFIPNKTADQIARH